MWLIYSLLAAVVWGVDYAIAEKVLQRISITTLLVFELLAATVVLGIFSLFGTLRQDTQTLLASPQLLGYLLVGMATFTFGNLLIGLSIGAKNATLASLIEISYPIFVVLTTWLLFRQSHLSPSVLIGGGLIFLGVSVIYYFN